MPRSWNGKAWRIFLEGRHDSGLPFAEHGAAFGPGAVDVGQIEGMSELAVGAVAGVGDQVDLGEAGLGDIPVIGFDRDVVLEQRAGLGAAVEAAAQHPLAGLEPAVDLARADGAQLTLEFGGQLDALAQPRQPQWQHRLQAHRPRVAAASQTCASTWITARP